MDRQRKRELRGLNARAWAEDKDVFPTDSSLDSSMKKNTAFIKRLRTSIAGSATATFLTEIRSLSLQRYLSEIISACYEGLCKVKLPADIDAAVEVFSALHQRFGPEEFTGLISWHIGRGLSTPDKAQLKALSADVREREEKERLSRYRVLLRVATELWLVGALKSLDDMVRPEDVGKGKENAKVPNTAVAQKLNGTRNTTSDAEPFPLEVLKEMTGQDSQHVNLPLMVQWIKVFGWDLLGKQSADDDQVVENEEPLVDEAMQQRYKNVLTRYFEGAVTHLLKDQQALNAQEKRNAEAYVRSGEVFEDRQANFDRQTKAQERFVANMQTLADALDLPMPELSMKTHTGASTDGSVGLVKAAEYLRGDGEGAGIWEDEEERRFYENITDLKTRVPSTLLEEPKKKKTDGDDAVGKRLEEKTEADKPDSTSDADKSTAIANQSVGAQVDAILARLPDLATKESVDEVAYDFCYVNSKASRNRLIKTVQEIPRGRTDLLPLYGRLVTTLGKYMLDIPEALVSHLDDEFRSLQRRKQKDSLGGVRNNNIRYLAELTKFGLVPEHVIFHCLKVSLDDFSRMNIDIICNLLENCGRYLLRNATTSPRMNSFLETLKRKKSAQHLGQQERMLIENAMYYVNPPERAAIQQKERTPMDLFVRKLIYLDLSKRNIEKIAKQLRKLHWEEQEVRDILHKVFVKPYNIKYSNVQFLAIILGALNRYHQEFAITVIDDLLENITLGLEDNDFKFNQRRIAEVRYLGELYVYRMVDSSIIFDTLFKISNFGHGGWPMPDNFTPLDPPDDFFRVRLICTLLETCGTYYEKGAARKKLDFFLTFFQYYIRTKDSLPMDVEFDLQDVFALVRPQWKLATTLEEAGALFAEACKEQYRTTASDRPASPMENEEPDGLDGEGDMDGRRTPDLDKSSDEENDIPDDDQISSPDEDSDDEEHIIVNRPEDERDPEAEAEFDREFARMMAESMESRKVDKRPMQEISLPTRNRGPQEMNGDGSQQSDAPTTTKFALLSKKGNKPQTRAIDLPSDSNFAVAMRSQQEAERAEQQRIKRLVLNYDSTRDDEDDAANGVLTAADRSVTQNATSNSAWPALHSSSADSAVKSQPGRSIGRRQQTRRLDLKNVDWT